MMVPCPPSEVHALVQRDREHGPAGYVQFVVLLETPRDVGTQGDTIGKVWIEAPDRRQPPKY
jgi:hypothetical protein